MAWLLMTNIVLWAISALLLNWINRCGHEESSGSEWADRLRGRYVLPSSSPWTAGRPKPTGAIRRGSIMVRTPASVAAMG